MPKHMSTHMCMHTFRLTSGDMAKSQGASGDMAKPQGTSGDMAKPQGTSGDMAKPQGTSGDMARRMSLDTCRNACAGCLRWGFDSLSRATIAFFCKGTSSSRTTSATRSSSLSLPTSTGTRRPSWSSGVLGPCV